MLLRRARQRPPLSWRCWFLVGLAAASAYGCGDQAALTELVVVVDTDFDIPAELNEIALTVEGPSGMQYPVVAELGAPGSPTLPLFTFLEPGKTQEGPIEITAIGRLGQNQVITQRVRTSFLPGQSRTLHMMLLRSCEDVTCTDGTTCVDGGCRSIDVPPESLPRWTGSLDGGRDAAADAGMDGGDACVAATETCNGMDDDCDGAIDEDFDLMADPANCGACGVSCEDQPRSSVMCRAGSCALACDPGFDNCDALYETGCEVDLSAPSNCGACENTCSEEAPFCESSTGCVSGCAPDATLCGLACVDAESDISHCGACEAACPDAPRSVPVCMTGSCGFTCDPGFGDCDGVATTGCEEPLNTTTSCGACGTPCVIPHATADCTSGTCQLGSCDAGYADCDGVTSNGCEVVTRTIYQDLDGDGFGDPAVSAAEGCTAMSGWVDNDRDCDDSRVSANPGAPEICNQLDDDCDGSTDERLGGCGDTCATAMVVEGSNTFDRMYTCGADDHGDAPCDWAGDAPDQVYQLELTADTTVAFTVTGPGHPTVWIDSSCSSRSSTSYCAEHADVGTVPLPAGTHFLHIEFNHTSCGAGYDMEINYL